MSETLGAALKRTAAALAAAGIDEARSEARRLIGWATGLDAAGLIAREDERLDPDGARRLDAALGHRLNRRPLAHLEGWTEFHGLALRTDARALIPRSDSECVVDLAQDHLRDDEPALIADLGTGSGCLLLALLSRFPLLQGVGIDESADALALARDNAAGLGLVARASFTCARWSDWQGWKDCDLIVSNPPYIATDEIAALQPEVRDHEPRLALAGGPDGLGAYREIVAIAGQAMKTGAVLVLEIGHDQRRAVTELLESLGFADIVLRRDLEGRDRAISALKP